VRRCQNEPYVSGPSGLLIPIRRESGRSVRTLVELSRRALRFRLVKSRIGVRPKPREATLRPAAQPAQPGAVPKTLSAASQPSHHDRHERQIEPRGNVPDNKQKGEARVERSFTLGSFLAACLDCPRGLSRNPSRTIRDRARDRRRCVERRAPHLFTLV